MNAQKDADVIVVGAGPGGSATAFHLANRGLDVLMFEKTSFPREKVCGDGLTPRAVKQILDMGIEPTVENGWLRNKGLRVIGGGHRLELDWPDVKGFPNYGLVRPRSDFDELLARTAQKRGVRLHEKTRVTGPIMDEKTGRMVGVTTKNPDGSELLCKNPTYYQKLIRSLQLFKSNALLTIPFFRDLFAKKFKTPTHQWLTMNSSSEKSNLYVPLPKPYLPSKTNQNSKLKKPKNNVQKTPLAAVPTRAGPSQTPPSPSKLPKQTPPAPQAY